MLIFYLTGLFSEAHLSSGHLDRPDPQELTSEDDICCKPCGECFSDESLLVIHEFEKHAGEEEGQRVDAREADGRPSSTRRRLFPGKVAKSRTVVHPYFGRVKLASDAAARAFQLGQTLSVRINKVHRLDEISRQAVLSGDKPEKDAAVVVDVAGQAGTSGVKRAEGESRDVAGPDQPRNDNDADNLDAELESLAAGVVEVICDLSDDANDKPIAADGEKIIEPISRVRSSVIDGVTFNFIGLVDLEQEGGSGFVPGENAGVAGDLEEAIMSAPILTAGLEMDVVVEPGTARAEADPVRRLSNHCASGEEKRVSYFHFI